MASRTPQRTEIELPSGAVATVRKASARDMRLAEQAKDALNRMSLTATLMRAISLQAAGVARSTSRNDEGRKA